MQIAIADDIAADLTSRASANKCSMDDLLRSMLYRSESDDEMVQRLSTPELGQRMVAGLADVDAGNFTTSEEVDKKFDALFAHLRSR